MSKIYVLDTSAIVDEPTILYSFKDSIIIIPFVVLEELDKLKTFNNDASRNARLAIRFLDQIFEDSNIAHIQSNCKIRIEFDYDNLFDDMSYGDNQIVACAVRIKKTYKKDVTLITSDINLKVKAKSMDLKAESFASTVSIFDMYPYLEMCSDIDLLTKIQLHQQAEDDMGLVNNSFILFEDEYGKSQCLSRKHADGKIKLIKKHNPWGLSCKNKEQSCLVDLIMDKNVSLVTAMGVAGSGKSLLAIACALELVLEQKAYDKLIIYRPIQSTGNELGHLPGPQPLDAKIVTPSGWTTMGQLKIGDQVISRDGKATKVIGVYPKGTKSIYKVSTTDGRSTECCEDHLWFTQTDLELKNGLDGSVRTTKDIINEINNKNIKHYLPTTSAVEYLSKQLPIKPYTLGALIGDGFISENHLTLSSKDDQIINRVASELDEVGCVLSNNGKNINYNIVSKEKHNNKVKTNIVKITNLSNGEIELFDSTKIASDKKNIKYRTLISRCNRKTVLNGFKYEFDGEFSWKNNAIKILSNLGLTGKKAFDKFIPSEYLLSSIEDRVSLLNGLMDTDGSISKQGWSVFYTSSEQLASDVVELVRSLGGISKINSRDRIGDSHFVDGRKCETKKISYEVSVKLGQEINPFYLSRKSSRHIRKTRKNNLQNISSIEYVGEKEVQCIRVDNPEHLYLTDDFIVTHNTQEEKLAPYFSAVMDSFEFLLAHKNPDWKRMFDMYVTKGKIELDSITYIRGRSIPNALIILDEGQNVSERDMKTFLTRAGQNSKIIITCDLEQVDSDKLNIVNNGAAKVMQKFKGSELYGHVTLTKGERSKLAAEAAKLL